MGLVYDSRDTDRVKTALSRNLATAVTTLADVERACGRLTGALGSGQLSGEAYSAIGALFSGVIVPSIGDARADIASLQKDADRFAWEDAKISRFGVLKEDELRVQIQATKNQREATERLIEVNEEAATALAGLPLLSEALPLVNKRLETVLNHLETELRDLEDRLAALQHFDSATRGLFQKRLATTTVAAMVTASMTRKDLPAGKGPSGWTDSELMNFLSLLSPSQVEQLLSRNPELAQRFWDTPPAPETVATWWKGLSPADREKWCQAAPSIIGNLPGLDADTRIHANTIQFQRDLHDPTIDPNSPRGIVLRDILKALGVDKFSGPGLDYEQLAKAQIPPHGLLAYNSTHRPPLAAVAVGETRAEKSGKVTWTVPGMNSGLGEPGRLSGWTGAAANLWNEQEDTEPGIPHMVVAWIGYEPPTQDASVLQGDRARAGASRLSKELDGQWAADNILGGNRHPFTAVVGHSYGTTVVTDALSSGNTMTHNVQSVVLLASAGVEPSIPHADTLSVDGGAGHVYVSQSSQDTVANLGRTLSGRSDPRDDLFGAQEFSSEGDLAHKLAPTDGHDPVGHGTDRGDLLAPHASKGHGYLDRRTEAIHNTAAASLGLDDQINGGTRAGFPSQLSPRAPS
jgi:hypothetical protein